MKREIEILLKRAEGFVKDALEDLKRDDYDLAMFHIEQACQLIVKAKLVKRFKRRGNRKICQRKLEHIKKLGVCIYSIEIFTGRI